MQSLRLKGGGEAAALVTKRFALPERVPFDMSDGNFSIANALQVLAAGRGSALERDAGERASERARSRGSRTSRQKSATRASAAETGAISSRAVQAAAVQESSEADAKAGTLSASTPGGSIYLYSITGVLLAEYSRINGVFQPVKDYIYVGNKLLAEYRHAEAKTYFYQQDQINSTRVVTDEAGTVVYSAAHDPYGGIQQTWVNTFDPAPKFSGKERDGESGLDYFGARYYDRAQYRFVSVDPEISQAAIGNPQRWNMYAYCGNNPICYFDPDGRSYIYWYPDLQILELYSEDGSRLGRWNASNYTTSGHTAFGDGSWTVDGFSYPGDWGYLWGLPGTKYGSYGFLNVIGNSGKVIHSGREGNPDGYGRSGWRHCTDGCIRTTDQAMWDMWVFNNDDPITRIYTVRIVKTPLPPAKPLPDYFVLPAAPSE